MKSFLISTLLASAAYAHMQMSNPYPIRSPLNKQATGPVDYSYTNPLSSDGSNFPCKGYQNDPFNSMATYTPGQEATIELQGSATHEGGSCQISLSYDNGKSFQVIHSMLGKCPLQTSYKFKIPADAPAGEALLAWSWFNKIGNREMYMNCAQVTIGSGSGARLGKDQDTFKAISRRDAFSSLPPLFIANVNGPGQCKTIEGEEVNFPLPGPSVEGSLTGKGYTCSGDAPFLGSGSSSSGSGSGSGSGSSTTSSSAVAHASLASPSSSGAKLFATPSPSTTPQSSSLAAQSSSNVASSFGATSPGRTSPTPRPEHAPAMRGSQPCVPGTIICAPDGQSWSLCAHGVPIFMGSVAAGMHCVNGGMHRLP